MAKNYISDLLFNAGLNVVQTLAWHDLLAVQKLAMIEDIIQSVANGLIRPSDLKIVMTTLQGSIFEVNGNSITIKEVAEHGKPNFTMPNASAHGSPNANGNTEKPNGK